MSGAVEPRITTVTNFTMSVTRTATVIATTAATATTTTTTPPLCPPAFQCTPGLLSPCEVECMGSKEELNYEPLSVGCIHCCCVLVVVLSLLLLPCWFVCSHSRTHTLSILQCAA